MASLILAARANEDLDRLTGFLLESDPQAAVSTAAIILEGIKILAQHPLAGRKVDATQREMVISRGRTGYIALYSYDDERDVVLIQAIRHQREAGFED